MSRLIDCSPPQWNGTKTVSGRVSAVILTATYGARPVGALMGAALADRIGLDACLWVSTAGFLVQFVVLFTSPVARLQSQPRTVEA